MKISNYIKCNDFPCQDVNRECYLIPGIDIDPARFSIFMISEAPPQDSNGYFYAKNNPSFLQTTIQSFNDAGLNVSSAEDLLGLGVYITTAVKCGKIGYSVSSKTIGNCSIILEKEIGLFPKIKVLLLMGDVAIKATNYIARRDVGKVVIPNGSTYKIRKNEYFYGAIRAFPSYLQTGKNYLIEKSKRKMIAEDIRAAFEILSYP